MKIIEKVESTKRRFASWLTSSSEQYSQKTKKLFLITTGIVGSAICLILILSPFFKAIKNQKAAAINIESTQADTLLTKEDRKTLEGFLLTLDSIEKVDQSAYKKAMTGRETLIDSIRFLLQYAGKTLTEQ